MAEGIVKIDVIDGETKIFSESFSCPDCGISIDEIEPRSFSFNNPFGACPCCTGLGFRSEFDVDLMIPDKSLSIAEGAIAVMGWQSCTDSKSYTYAILSALQSEMGLPLDVPYEKLSDKHKNLLLHGTNGRKIKVLYQGSYGGSVHNVEFEGLIKNVQRRYRETSSDVMKQEYETFQILVLWCTYIFSRFISKGIDLKSGLGFIITLT